MKPECLKSEARAVTISTTTANFGKSIPGYCCSRFVRTSDFGIGKSALELSKARVEGLTV